jgi:hypothetical protein
LVNQKLLLQNEYLAAENRILKASFLRDPRHGGLGQPHLGLYQRSCHRRKVERANSRGSFSGMDGYEMFKPSLKSKVTFGFRVNFPCPWSGPRTTIDKMFHFVDSSGVVSYNIALPVSIRVRSSNRRKCSRPPESPAMIFRPPAKVTTLRARIAMESDHGQTGFQVPHLQRVVPRRGNGPPAVRRHLLIPSRPAPPRNRPSPTFRQALFATTSHRGTSTPTVFHVDLATSSH